MPAAAQLVGLAVRDGVGLPGERAVAPADAGFSALRPAWPRTSQLVSVPVCCSSVCGACSLAACALCNSLISTAVQEASRLSGGMRAQPTRLWACCGGQCVACGRPVASPRQLQLAGQQQRWCLGPRGLGCLYMGAAHSRRHCAASGSLVTRMWPLPLTSALCWRQQLAAN